MMPSWSWPLAHGRHVRVAVGLDYLDACPVHGFHRGGKGDSLDVDVQVNEAAYGQRCCHQDLTADRNDRSAAIVNVGA